MLWVIGAKTIETRGWATKYRGPLLIHAAKICSAEQRILRIREPFQKALYGLGKLPLGYIIGKVDLIDCYAITPDNTPPEPERSFGDYSPGRYAWPSINPVRFDRPIEWKGKQGFFEVPDEVVSLLTASKRQEV